jgi:hypothetical protein
MVPHLQQKVRRQRGVLVQGEKPVQAFGRGHRKRSIVCGRQPSVTHARYISAVIWQRSWILPSWCVVEKKNLNVGSAQLKTSDCCCECLKSSGFTRLQLVKNDHGKRAKLILVKSVQHLFSQFELLPLKHIPINISDDETQKSSAPQTINRGRQLDPNSYPFENPEIPDDEDGDIQVPRDSVVSVIERSEHHRTC